MISERFTALVVDDSNLFRQRVACLLTDGNLHPVLQARNYEEAVNWLLQTKVHLALLDISMPGKNGIELLKLIRNRYPGTKVWMISNHADEYYKQVCLSTGADQFFDKSLDFEEIEKKTALICQEFQSELTD
jgi:DNA-binding NarL/FixJ family response regulator